MKEYNPETDCMLIVDGHHGVHAPALFCREFQTELENAGLGEKARLVIDYDRKNDVLIAEEETADINVDADTACEAWTQIEGEFTLKDNYGRGWWFQQGCCGDIFAIADDVELPEDFIL